MRARTKAVRYPPGPSLQFQLDLLGEFIERGQDVVTAEEVQRVFDVPDLRVLEAIELLTICLVLEPQRPADSSRVYALGAYLPRLLNPPRGPDMSYDETYEMAKWALQRVSSFNGTPKLARVTRISFAGGMLNLDWKDRLQAIDVHAQVVVRPLSGVGLEVRNLVDTLLGVGNKDVKLHVTLQTEGPEALPAESPV